MLREIDRLTIFEIATDETRRAIHEKGLLESFSKNEVIFSIRKNVDTIYIVVSGYGVIERESEGHGHRSIFLIGPGEIVNEVILDGLPSSSECRAIGDMTVLCIKRDLFLKLMEGDVALNQYVISSMALKIRKLYHMVESSTKTTKLDHQTAARLWKFARDYGRKKDGCIQLPFPVTITLLAGFVGSNRETISRVVKKMSQEGILTIEKGNCTIFDMDALREYGQ